MGGGVVGESSRCPAKATGAVWACRSALHLYEILGTMAVVASLLAATGCGGLAAVGSQTGARGHQEASRESVILAPNLGAGEGGWCVTTARGAGACPSAGMPVLRGPIIVEVWGGQGSSFGSGRAMPVASIGEGMVLTSSDVAAVSFAGGTPIPTHAESSLPDHLRGAILNIRSASSGGVPIAVTSARFIALNADGQPMPETRSPGPRLQFHFPSQRLGHSADSETGVCSVDATGISGSVFEGGAVMTALKPHTDVRGKEFVDCLQASYRVEGWPLEVDVLLDAAHPGSTPATLPVAQPLAGHHGVFVGPGLEAESLARRVSGGWLLVSKGKDLGQRLAVLEHLYVSIRT
jgi:hypothetical protein